MSIKSQVHQLISFIFALKDKNLAWQSANQTQLLKLAHEQALSRKTLEAELTKQSTQLAHELKLLKIQQNAELYMLKTRSKEDINDYRHYLESLRQLKTTIQTAYAHLPDAITLTIHHHAKALLNHMWEAESLADKISYERQLLKFMATVYEEARYFQTENNGSKLPENTLKLISQDKH